MKAQYVSVLIVYLYTINPTMIMAFSSKGQGTKSFLSSCERQGGMALFQVPFIFPRSIEAYENSFERRSNRKQKEMSRQVMTMMTANSGSEGATGSSEHFKPKTLPQTMRFRGQVDSGYGRGGKKLGFPTANLPSGLFQGALEDVPCGVYFGWAVLEDFSSERKGRNIPHKAVVNVGFSPTFEGQENPEKIVEAHLMFDVDASPLDPPDFYGEVMRLQLIGFIRPEMKFPSFPDLIAQISSDVENAKEALDLEMYQEFQRDAFIAAVDETWVGSGGGDKAASWEFQGV